MADLTPKPINELPSASALDGTELMALSQSGSAKKAALSALMSVLYPVGSIYLSVNNTSPATLFGGTWVQIKDTFLLAAGDTYSAGATGGEAAHTLVANELPKIDGGLTVNKMVGSTTRSIITDTSGVFSVENGSVITGVKGSDEGVYSSEVTMTFGNNQAHNNMPPYLAVYAWKRTA